ncbi:MAG: hypothetical protein AAB774_01575 [Patescibacteria group bacterium]
MFKVGTIYNLSELQSALPKQPIHSCFISSDTAGQLLKDCKGPDWVGANTAVVIGVEKGQDDVLRAVWTVEYSPDKDTHYIRLREVC